MYERDNNDESSNRHYQSLVSEWSNPPCSNTRDLDRKIKVGTRETETSKYPEEKKSYEIPLVAASESGGV